MLLLDTLIKVCIFMTEGSNINDYLVKTKSKCQNCPQVNSIFTVYSPNLAGLHSQETRCFI